MNSHKSLCPCFSNKTYEECCKPYHNGKLPENALKLMRSRYSAYALCLPTYIIDTTHPENIHYQKDKKSWACQILDFSKNTKFEGLEVISFIDGENEAYVTFFAYLSQDNKDVSFKEKSRFEKVNDKWLYLENCPIG